MFAVAVLRPTQPRGDSLFVGFRVKRRLPFVELGGGTAEILFYALSDELLFPVKLVTDIIKPLPVPVVSVHGNREDLPIILNPQFKFLFEIGLDKLVKEPPQRFLAFAIKGEVVGVFLAVYLPNLIHFVHEIGKEQVGEVLRQVVPIGTPSALSMISSSSHSRSLSFILRLTMRFSTWCFMDG